MKIRIEVSASAEEVLPRVKDPSQSAKIANFVLALCDAQSLWRYTINSGTDRMRIQKISGYYAPLNYPQELGDRWNSEKFLDMVERYGLHQNNFDAPIIDYGDRPELLFDRAIQHIFHYATKTFRELDNTQ
jgi:hypothetical protein